MLTKIGIGSLIAGLFLGIFSGISRLMQSQNYWVDLTLSKIFGQDKTEAFITITSSEFIQNALDAFMYDLPLFVLLLTVGIICLLFGLFVKDF